MLDGALELVPGMTGTQAGVALAGVFLLMRYWKKRR